MLLIDDLLLLPARGILAVFREIHNAAQQEVANEAEAIRTQLSDLYMMLETGGITEDEFERQEKELLDRLDEIEAAGTGDKERGESDDADGLQEQSDGGIGSAQEQALISRAP